MATSENKASIRDDGSPRYLDEKQLAQRLGLSVKFLRRRRDLRQAPQYAKFGNRVRYPIESVEAFEAAALELGCGVRLATTRP
ncbi:helix-turn-helix transcriptional regulator [Sphingomonas sp. Leaf339]|uniref:helix-turn-helix transcriptional regulator n=1 Tax=Sphingomonas sp. Leaf339 TaxID=1736343 RepID=UPI0009E87A8C|nr:hypothetical protein [Sphingomonas sp. Leaf339]